MVDRPAPPCPSVDTAGAGQRGCGNRGLPALLSYLAQIRHRVAKVDGPERILGEWWGAKGVIGMPRDYYRVENASGERSWQFREAFDPPSPLSCP
jgi:hypothetical protein